MRSDGASSMIHPISRFEAMPKLLDETELGELARQRGFDSHLIGKLRRARRRTYGLYLTELSDAFQSLAKEALDRGANDPGVDPAFVDAVLKVKMRFTISVWLLRASLWLPAGITSKAQQLTIDLVGSLKPLAARAI
jgi:hypothetical protein